MQRGAVHVVAAGCSQAALVGSDSTEECRRTINRSATADTPRHPIIVGCGSPGAGAGGKTASPTPSAEICTGRGVLWGCREQHREVSSWRCRRAGQGMICKRALLALALVVMAVMGHDGETGHSHGHAHGEEGGASTCSAPQRTAT